MNHQEKEIRNLNKTIDVQGKTIAIQGDLLNMNKDILVPMYKKRIKQLEEDLKYTQDLLHAMDKELMEYQK